MNKNIIITSIILALLIIGSFSGYKIIQNKKINFATCLNEQGVTMYGTKWCTYCKAQKDLFGDAFNYANYIDCDLDTKTCQEEGIESYPTWKSKTGATLVGKQSFASLEKISTCKY